MDEKQENARLPEASCQQQKPQRIAFPSDAHQTSAALLGLHAQVANGNIPREHALVHATVIFGIDPKDARKLFPAPKK